MNVVSELSETMFSKPSVNVCSYQWNAPGAVLHSLACYAEEEGQYFPVARAPSRPPSGPVISPSMPLGYILTLTLGPLGPHFGPRFYSILGLNSTNRVLVAQKSHASLKTLYFLSKIVYTDSTYQICLLSHANFRFLKSDASLFY